MPETAITEIEEAPTTEATQRLTPWARMNTLRDDTTYDTVDLVLKDAALDFTVSKRPIQFQHADGTWAQSPNRMYVVRDDTEQPIDVVSSDYGVFQYSQAFEFLKHLPGREFVSAAPLKDARQAFIVVRLPDLDVLEVGDDRFELNVVVRTSHDRSRAVEVFTMPVRVWCVNQLPLRSMRAGIKNRWSVNHVGNVGDKMHDAQVLVDNVREYAADFVDTVERLMSIDMTSKRAERILTRVLRDTPRRADVVNNILELWDGAPTVGDYQNVAWGFVNAVSDYMEHGRRGGTAQSRLLNALEGQTRNTLDKVITLTLGGFGS